MKEIIRKRINNVLETLIKQMKNLGE